MTRPPWAIMILLAALLLVGGCKERRAQVSGNELVFTLLMQGRDINSFFRVPLDGPTRVVAGEPATYTVEGAGNKVQENSDCPNVLTWFAGSNDKPELVRRKPSSKVLGLPFSYCGISGEKFTHSFPPPPGGKASYTTSVKATVSHGMLQHSESLQVEVLRDPNAPILAFRAPQTYDDPEHPTAVAAGEFSDSDGLAELAVSDDRSDPAAQDVVWIYDSLGINVQPRSGPAITNPIPIGPGKDPTDVATGDVNGDGRLDLIVASEQKGNAPGFSDHVQVLINNSDGNFTLQGPYGVAPAPQELATADFDQDGDLDVATASRGPGGPSGTVSVLLNNGDGTFQSPDFSFDAGGAPVAIAAADLNGDGLADIALANPVQDRVTFLRNLGPTGGPDPVNFAAPQSFATLGRNPEGIDAGDVNGDGKPDLALADTGSDSMTVLVNSTAPASDQITVSSRRPPAGSTNDPKDAELGALDGDGELDVATANHGSSDVSLFIGDGTGAFSDGFGVGVGPGPRDLALVDLNSDSRDDVVSANSSAISVLFSSEAAETGSAAHTPREATPAEFDRTRPKPRIAKKKKKGTLVGVIRGLEQVATGKARPTKAGVVKIKGALLAVKVKLAARGGKKAKRKLMKVPKSARRAINATALARVNITYFPEGKADVPSPVRISGTMVTKPAKAKGKNTKGAARGGGGPKTCSRLTIDSREKKNSKLKLLGGTGKAKRLAIGGKLERTSVRGKRGKIRLEVPLKLKSGNAAGAKKPPKKCKPLLKRVKKL